MIYTLTLNPSLDYYMEFESLKSKDVNRSTSEYFRPGGKGINVSIVLNNLKIPSRAMGFLGGFTQEYFIEMLEKYEYIKPNFTYIDENTRINIKAIGEEELTMNAIGPNISEKEKAQMLRRLDNMNKNDILVLSGSYPSNCLDLIESMMNKCVENNVHIVLDTNPKMMKSLLKHKPLLIKPNIHELEDMLDVSISSKDEIVHYADEILSLGVQNCIVTVGADGAYLINKDGVFHSSVCQGETVNTTGCGDSVVAGFLMNYLRSRDILPIFKYASACGCATAFSKGLATREEVDAIVDEIVVTKIK